MSAPTPEELKRVYDIHQRHLEKARLKAKKPERMAYNRERAKLNYQQNKQAILEKRKAYREAHKDELNKKAMERYYSKKETEPEATTQNWMDGATSC